MSHSHFLKKGEVRLSFGGRLAILCLSFLAGLFLGWRVCLSSVIQESQQLGQYLTGYSQWMVHADASPVSFLNAVSLYFRYPFFAFLFGFTSLGIILIPLLCATEGFFLSFAVTSFVSAMDKGGILVALCALGIRCVVTVPCILFLAVCAMDASEQLRLRGSFGYHKNRGIYDSAYFARFGVCAAVLFFGALLETAVVPRLFELIDMKIF